MTWTAFSVESELGICEIRRCFIWIEVMEPHTVISRLYRLLCHTLFLRRERPGEITRAEIKTVPLHLFESKSSLLFFCDYRLSNVGEATLKLNSLLCYICILYGFCSYGYIFIHVSIFTFFSSPYCLCFSSLVLLLLWRPHFSVDVLQKDLHNQISYQNKPPKLFLIQLIIKKIC